MSSQGFSDDGDYCFIINNLSPNTDREKLWEVFGDFGTIKQIELNTELSVAAVIYAFKPLDQLHSQLIYINDRLISIKHIPLADYLTEESTPIPVNKLLLGGLALQHEFIEEWATQEFVTFDINLKRNYIDVFFAHVDGYYRFRIDYDEKDLKNMCVLQRHDNISSITILGKYPARFWKSKIPMQNLEDTYHLKHWDRVVEIPLDEFSRDIMKQKATATSKDPIVPGGRFPNHTVNISNWTAYRLEFDIPLKSAKNMPLCLQNMSHEALEKKLYRASGSPLISTSRIQVRCPTKLIDIDTHTTGVSFEVQYMIEHAFNLKILRGYNVEADFFLKMRRLPPQVACLFLNLLSAPQQRVYNAESEINRIYASTKDHSYYEVPIPEDCFLLRKVLVTPTSIYPLQPTIEPMNHVQYHLKKYADRFMLIQFTDEDLSPISPTYPVDDQEEVDTQNDKIYDRIYQVLRKGLSIARRTYEFIGTSTDDLRAHQCWFFAKTDEISRADILSWMGDFRELTKVTDFVSCVGQVFAPRLMDIELKKDEIEEVDDYNYNGYVYTNNCGKMSSQIARDVAKHLDMDYTPSVIRFNLAGAKGILMLSNFLTKRKVQLRSTQIKFNSKRLTLEVIKVSKPNKVYLSRSIISLLSSLGIKNYVFQDLLNEAMSQYKKEMLPRDEVTYDLAGEFYADGRLDEFQNIVDCGFLDANDPFINNLMSAYRNNALRGIREECKLYVHQGVKVFAIMDETGTLGPEEVFIQIADTTGLAANRQIIEGPCLVYRDSSCFPGDARVVTAVNEIKLRHYTNVLVYSSIDARDLPSACSNDDVDQDNFNVIWDLKLIPNKINLAPRNYVTAMTPNELSKISFKEMARFFTTYISKDRLNSLKKAYIAISDRHKEGILHGDCIYLSQQMSRALDFAKTGLYATIYSEFHHYPFPDFMKENKLCSYVSKKPSGQIYRMSQNIVPKQYIRNYCAYEPFMYVENMYEYIADARKTKAKYDHSLRLLLGQYSVQSEIEFISGHIVNWPKYLSVKDKPEFVERIRLAYIRFKKDWRKKFEVPDENLEAKAAAWYYVTYHPSEYKSDVTYNSTMARYMSFPWVVDNYILFIANSNSTRAHEDRFLQPVPAEKINSAVKKSSELLFVSEDEDDDESNSESEDDEEAEAYEDDLKSNHEDLDQLRGSAHVISVKLSDLIL